MEIQTNPNPNETMPIFSSEEENDGRDFLSITVEDINNQFDNLAQEGERILKNPNYEGIDREKIESQIIEAGELKTNAINEIESITKH